MSSYTQYNSQCKGCGSIEDLYHERCPNCWKLKAQQQTLKEDKLSIRALMAKIRREWPKAPTMPLLAITEPLEREGKIRVLSCAQEQYSAWRDDYFYPCVYTGKLANYWTTVLGHQSA